MPLQARVLKASLQGKFGFAALDRGEKHDWLQLLLPNIRPVTVMFSKGEKEIGDKLLGMICRQLRVARPYLNGMVECSNSSEAYRKKLVDEA